MDELYVTSCNVSKEKPDLHEVVFNDGNKALFSYDEIIKYSLYEGSNPKADNYDNLILNTNIDRAFEKSLSFVLLRARTCEEVRNKLSELEFDPLVIDKVLQKLNEYKYLDDIDYCMRYIRTSSKLKLVSVKMLEFELLQKGIDSDIIKDCIDKSKVDEYSNAREILRKKCRNMQNIDNKAKQKLERLLYSKGFEFTLIKDVMEELVSNEDD